KLLAQPYRRIEALALIGCNDLPEEITSFHPSIDDETIKSCEAQITQLEAEIDQANRDGAFERVANLRTDQQKIECYLRENTNIRGEGRRLGQPPAKEKARKAVRNDLDRARKRIAETMPGLARFLKQYIRAEDTTFAYRPPQSFPEWVGLPLP